MSRGNCRYCGTALKSNQYKYCSTTCDGLCRSLKAKTDSDNRILKGEESEPRRLREYLIEHRGHQCEICKLTEWQGAPIPLTLNHRNGNSDDNDLDNLQMICPNCDRQTPFFGAKNRGNGRHYRRLRYKEGKSY